MKYTVRSKEGELVYDSFGQIEQAWLSGLVEPEDEILEAGTTKWRKANSFPVLMRARRSGNQVWGGSQMAWMVLSICFLSWAFYLIAHGNYPLGLLIAFVTSSLLIRVTYKAFKRTKPHP